MTYTADKRLWATVDGKVVEDGDPRAAVLIATPGSEMSDEDAARYGLKTAGEKAVKAPPENKQINQPPSNKRR